MICSDFSKLSEAVDNNNSIILVSWTLSMSSLTTSNFVVQIKIVYSSLLLTLKQVEQFNNKTSKRTLRRNQNSKFFYLFFKLEELIEERS